MWQIFKQAAGTWLERNAFVHAGSLAFYTLFSLAPVVIIAVSIAGMVFGQDAARGQLVGRLDEFIGADAARAIEDAVARSRPTVAGFLPTVAGLIALVVGATTVFAQMQISLNRIWGVVAKPKKSDLIILITSRLLSLAIILAIGFVLLVSLMLNVALNSAIRFANARMPVSPRLLDGLEVVLSFIVIAALFALIFKVLPDVEIGWADVRLGAVVAGLLFVLGRGVIAFYLAYTAPASTYGAAGSLVLLLLWVYYSSLILFFGAALTKAQLLASGRPIVPQPIAVRVKEEIIEGP